MKKRTKTYFISGTLGAGILLGWYGLKSPVVIYGMGKIQSALARPGRITSTTIRKLNVPYHRQEHSLSCEAASLKMVLNYIGLPISESEIIQALDFDTTANTQYTWGDPSVGFVGDIDGKMPATGYGIYWEPIAKVAGLWRPAQIITHATAQDVARHITENRPVIVWGYFGNGHKINWRTPAGKLIEAVNGEHTRVITGFVGSAENPEGFTLLDPIYGELFWSTEQLMNNWSAFNFSGVVVY